MEDRLTLPEAVRQRLGLDGPMPGVTVVAPKNAGTMELHLEGRRSKVEIRQTEDGIFSIEGYASTTETPYEVAGGPPYGWSEIIARDAFDKALAERDDVRLLVNHDGIPLARSKSGTLELRADGIGLFVRADNLDLRNPTAQEMRSAMERGDIDEMSFAFRATRQEWNEDYTERRITELRLFDVSVVTYPANPATHVHIRSGEPDEVPAVGMPLRLAKAHADALRVRA